MKLDFLRLIPNFARYKLQRTGLMGPSSPYILTFSVTNMCNSRCKTCDIWKHGNQKEAIQKELTLKEIEKIFKNMQGVFFFNLSGGEPYLRKDLPQIIELACKYLKPSIIHSTTNCILNENVVTKTKEILDIS